jgi:arsenate reductase (glutaredoxin)
MLAQAVRFAIATRVTTMPAPLTIYHNPACTKSRETLALIRERGLEPHIVEYLKTPPSEAELSAIVRKLGIKPLELVRTGEQVFKDKYKGKTLSDKEWIKAMVANPILIQRPIVVRGEAAAIGRPPQDVEPLLKP